VSDVLLSVSIPNTLGDNDWLARNEQDIKQLLPQDWQQITPELGARIGFKLKILGIDWRSQDEFKKCLLFLEKIGFIQRDGLKIRANPKRVT
jgi:hypothetical protein